jgi:hypothetical protein
VRRGDVLTSRGSYTFQSSGGSIFLFKGVEGNADDYMCVCVHTRGSGGSYL